MKKMGELTLENLCAEHQKYKADEKTAQDARRVVEDKMLSLIGLSGVFEVADNPTANAEAGGYKIKITGRTNYKIDADQLQEIAASNGLEGHLPSLFRWTPDINMRAWKGAHESITRPLSAAITSTPGRPSFLITKAIGESDHE